MLSFVSQGFLSDIPAFRNLRTYYIIWVTWSLMNPSLVNNLIPFKNIFYNVNLNPIDLFLPFLFLRFELFGGTALWWSIQTDQKEIHIHRDVNFPPLIDLERHSVETRSPPSQKLPSVGRRHVLSNSHSKTPNQRFLIYTLFMYIYISKYINIYIYSFYIHVFIYILYIYI